MFSAQSNSASIPSLEVFVVFGRLCLEASLSRHENSALAAAREAQHRTSAVKMLLSRKFSDAALVFQK
jgi:hypothetical protein